MAAAVTSWDHEKLTGTTLAGDPLLDVGGSGRHYGGTACHGRCCDPPSADALAEFHPARGVRDRQPYFDRRFMPPAGWQDISIVSVGVDPAGAVVEIAVQFDNGPTMFATPEALAALGVTVSVS